LFSNLTSITSFSIDVRRVNGRPIRLPFRTTISSAYVNFDTMGVLNQPIEGFGLKISRFTLPNFLPFVPTHHERHKAPSTLLRITCLPSASIHRITILSPYHRVRSYMPHQNPCRSQLAKAIPTAPGRHQPYNAFQEEE